MQTPYSDDFLLIECCLFVGKQLVLNELAISAVESYLQDTGEGPHYIADPCYHLLSLL